MGIVHTRQFLTTDEIFDLVREDLRGVEKAIAIESVASVDTRTPISKYLHQHNGQRLRPALLLLCARLAGGAASRLAIQMGAVVELLHAAALAHHDVIDAGQPQGRQANNTRVLAGDWLYIQAFRVAQRERLLHLALGAAQMMVTGELNQFESSGRLTVTEADCMELVDQKTACLFSVCGKLGAVAAGLDTCDAEKLGEFAWNLGMAFQLTDDILDFVPNESTPDKPVGADLRSGNVTLPLVYALEQANAEERDLVAGVLLNRSYNDVPFAKVRAIVNRYRGIQSTRARTRQFTERAKQILSGFPDSLCQRALFTLADLVTERDC